MPGSHCVTNAVLPDGRWRVSAAIGDGGVRATFSLSRSLSRSYEAAAELIGDSDEADESMGETRFMRCGSESRRGRAEAAWPALPWEGCTGGLDRGDE